MEPTTNDDRQVCSLSVMFPITTDEEAIAIKAKIAEVLVGIPESRIEFRLTTMKGASRGR